MCRDLGEYLTTLQLLKLFTEFDQDHNGRVEFNEFVCGVIRYINSHQQILSGTKERGLEGLRLGSDVELAGHEEKTSEEEEVDLSRNILFHVFLRRRICRKISLLSHLKNSRED